MHEYEIVYIIRSSLASEEIDGKLESFHARLTQQTGQISAVEHWGKRQLAYPIDKERSGHYVVAQFEATPQARRRPAPLPHRAFRGRIAPAALHAHRYAHRNGKRGASGWARA